jgi:cytochrome o ubiquinol oxidase subunit 2
MFQNLHESKSTRSITTKKQHEKRVIDQREFASIQTAQVNGMDVMVKQAVARRSYRAAIAVSAALLGGGCNLTHVPVLDPKGPITLAERDLLFTAVALMLIVIIPVFIMAFLFAWRYRSSNSNARYTPDWSYSIPVDAVVWLVPALIIVALGTLLWSNTHKLDPYKRIESTVPPIEVAVVAQDWKWLFIYPAQSIAVVNELVFPNGTPLNLKITSDTVMNSLSIPALGGQIFAMAGMQTRLHLLADAPGVFTGRNMQYSGRGFSNQHFQAIATSREDFDAWVTKVKQSPTTLDAAAYRALAAPTIGHPVTYYSAVEPKLFDTIIAKYTRGTGHAGHRATHETHVGKAQDAR